MRVLGIDPGTNCGWAVREPNGHYTSGVWDLKPGKDEGPGMRYIRLRGHLIAHELTRGGFARVFYEEAASYTSSNVNKVWGGIVATIQVFCEERGIPYESIHWAKVKQHATGKGNASKADMVVAAVRQWPEIGQDDNEADARWVVEAGMKGIGLGR